MADIKISALGDAGALTGTEVVPIVQAGTTVKTTTQTIANLAVTIAGVLSVVAGPGISVNSADPAHPVISASATSSLFDVTSYGAVGNGVTDCTTAIQNAINAAFAAGGGTIYFPTGIYIVGGALQNGAGANAQLLLPSVDYLDEEAVTIQFAGSMVPPCIPSVVGATPVPDAHSIIKSTLNVGVNGALLGGYNTGGLDNFTNVYFVSRSMTYRMPNNPVLSALNLTRVAAVDIDDTVVDCGGYYIQGLTDPTTSTSFGIRMPRNNNGAFSRLGAATNVIGFYNGFEFAEHSCGYATAWGCKQAFIMATATNHGSKFERLMAVHCPRAIVVAGPHYTKIDQLNIEHAASGWWAPIFDLDDASNQLQGDLEWHVVLAGAGVDATFLTNGGAKCNVRRLGFDNGVQVITASSAITFTGVYANKTILHPSADTTARIWTIPANASVPYPVGTCLTFVNQAAAGVLTIAINTDVLRLAGAGTTGSRQLAASGMATAIKITTGEWVINGAGLT